MTNVNASDKAKALARDNDLDLGEIEGTGANGNITKADVEKAIAAKNVPDDDVATPDPADQAADPDADEEPDLDPDAPEPLVHDGATPAEDFARAASEADEEAELAEAEQGDEWEPGDIRQITRVSDVENGAWWCPFCGHSQTPEINICQGCKAEYTGDGEVQAQ